MLNLLKPLKTNPMKMRVLIESNLNPEEIVESIDEASQSRPNWKEILGIKKVLFKEIKSSSKNTLRILGNSDWAKLKTLTRRPFKIRTIELINVNSGQDLEFQGEGLLKIIYAPQKSRLSLNSKETKVEKTFRTSLKNSFLIAIGDDIGFTIINKTSTNLQLLIFYN